MSFECDMRRIELERADAARRALEDAANRLEAYSANELYEKALRLGARLIRQMMNERF